MRGLAHRFHTAGEDHGCFAKLDQLSRGNNRLDAGTAQAIHRQGRNFNRKSRAKPDVASAVESIAACLKSISEYAVTEVGGVEFRLVHCSLRGKCTQFQSCEILESATVFAHWRALTC